MDPAAADVVCSGVTIDSRNVRTGDLFIAIKGERYDGHEFAVKAVEVGASAVMLSRDIPLNHGAVVRVADTQAALEQLASYIREQVHIPVIAITGSNGKTTTKDMAAAVFGVMGDVLMTRGNQNNEIGLPLTLLRLTKEHKAAIVEMGMRGFGQIEKLVKIARPDIAIVTNVSETHIELLGTRENIALAKSEIVRELPGSGWAVLNGDDQLVKQMAGVTKAQVCFYGLSEDNDIRAYNIVDEGEKGIRFTIHARLNGIDESREACITLPGIHNVMNALAAVSSALAAGRNLADCIYGLRNFTPTGMRMEVIKSLRGITIVNDTYNASPSSMRAALKTLSSIAGEKRKVGVLADMLELGDRSEELHRSVGEAAKANGLDILITVGEYARYIAEGFGLSGCVYSFSTKDDALELLDKVLKNDDVVLVKGSRGMKMEEVVHSLLNVEA